MSNDATPGDAGKPGPPGDPSRSHSPPDDEGHGGRHVPGGHRSGAYPFARSGFIEYDRVLFFTDAVIAIAITLLAVDLRVPESRSAELAVRPLYGFGISFAVIGLFWLGHHGIARYITAFDRPLIAINLLFLGTIAILPYPTELLSVPKQQSVTAVVFYAVCVGAAGLCEGAIWLYATRANSGLADPSASAVRLYYSVRIARVPVVFLMSIPVALVTPENAPYVWILVFVFGLAINRFIPQPDPPERIGE